MLQTKARMFGVTSSQTSKWPFEPADRAPFVCPTEGKLATAAHPLWDAHLCTPIANGSRNIKIN
jgi:hypothetical protein